MREKNDTPRTMYLILAIFVKESGCVFTKSKLVKNFLSNINKHLINLVMCKIIIDYGSWTTLAEAFVVVEEYICALSHYNAVDFVSLPVDSNKSRKTPVTTT